MPGRAMAGFVAGILRGRPPIPDDIVGAAPIPASAGSGCLTGQVVTADGGMVLV